MQVENKKEWIRNLLQTATIGRKILIISMVLVILPTLVLGYVAYTSASSVINDDIETNLNLQVTDIKDTTDSVYTLTQNKVNADLNVLRELFKQKGTPSISDGKLVLGGNYVVNDNFEVVDNVQGLVGGAATIFQKQGDKAVRISTNVIGEDGKRAVGTTVSDVVYDAVINKGQTYYGQAQVVGKPYIAAYEPIKDASGEIIGILFVGVDEESTLGVLKEQIRAKKIGQTGYVYVLDSEGNTICHPTNEGKNDSDLPFIQQILAQKEGIVRYSYNGDDKIAAVTYYEPLDWYIIANSPFSDFTGPITRLGTTIVIVMIVSIIGGCLIAILFGRSISRRMNELVGLAHQIRDGDLSVVVGDDTQKDEIGVLRRAFGEVVDTFAAFRDEVRSVSVSAAQGRLDARGDMTRFEGDYASIVEGFNETIDAMVVPVREAMTLSKNYANGDFTARVNPNLSLSGEFVTFKDALNTIGEDVSKALVEIQRQVGGLNKDMQEISEYVNRVTEETKVAEKSIADVSDGVGQVAQIAGAVNSLADQSGNTTQQILAAMQDLSTTVASVAAKMEQVSVLTNNTEELSSRGKEVAGRAEAGMSTILQSSSEIERMVQDISTQMVEIGRIVDIISSIAEQTNLLALNAAIEAARAGDAGLGFAVVAGEVKELANESQSSAENIASIIHALQQKTGTITSAVQGSLSEVKSGNEAVSETLELFNEIVGHIADINRNMNEAAAASEEQAASVEEVTATVNEFSDMVAKTAKEAVGLAAASEESSEAVHQIVSMVGQVNESMSDIGKTMEAAERSVRSINGEMSKFKS